jgi:hypothetical protein
MSTADTAQTILTTALQTAAAIAATDPKMAAAVALAPFIVQLLTAAAQMQQAGTLSQQALADLFVSIGTGVRSTDDAWTAMNAADAARAP